MNGKRIVIVLIGIIFLFTLTACGSQLKDPGHVGEENTYLEMSSLTETYLQRLEDGIAQYVVTENENEIFNLQAGTYDKLELGSILGDEIYGSYYYDPHLFWNPDTFWHGASTILDRVDDVEEGKYVSYEVETDFSIITTSVMFLMNDDWVKFHTHTEVNPTNASEYTYQHTVFMYLEDNVLHIEIEFESEATGSSYGGGNSMLELTEEGEVYSYSLGGENKDSETYIYADLRTGFNYFKRTTLDDYTEYSVFDSENQVYIRRLINFDESDLGFSIEYYDNEVFVHGVSSHNAEESSTLLKKWNIMYLNGWDILEVSQDYDYELYNGDKLISLADDYRLSFYKDFITLTSQVYDINDITEMQLSLENQSLSYGFTSTSEIMQLSEDLDHEFFSNLLQEYITYDFETDFNHNDY